MKKLNKVTNEDLARMVKKGFDDVYEKFDESKNYVDKKFSAVHKELNDIKLRIDNLAPYFELKALEKRVEKLELKLNLKG